MYRFMHDGDTMHDENFTERLPVVRVTPSFKERLERVATRSINPRLSDHIRYALEQYIAMAEETDQRNAEQPLHSA